MAKKRLFVDMDGTLARFHDQANYLERMFEKNFFRDLEPFENMVEGIRQFIQLHPDVDVYILSAKVDGEPPYCEGEKHAWLDKYLPEIPPERRIFTKMGHRKAEFIQGSLTKDDYLLDDYNKGLHQFMFDGGSSIKCHNNINQKGLGTFGGQHGYLWVGSMVHTDDKPSLIAAELSSHMGLHYDLKPVMDEYSGVNLSDSTFAQSNPFNSLRVFAGKEEFKEIGLGADGHLKVPEFLLRAISSNLYRNPDFDQMLQSNPSQFAEDVKFELEQSQLPIVGQIDILAPNGEIKTTSVFRSFDEMQNRINSFKKCGQPIDVRWNVNPSDRLLKKPSLSSLIQNAKVNPVGDKETTFSVREQSGR